MDVANAETRRRFPIPLRCRSPFAERRYITGKASRFHSDRSRRAQMEPARGNFDPSRCLRATHSEYAGLVQESKRRCEKSTNIEDALPRLLCWEMNDVTQPHHTQLLSPSHDSDQTSLSSQLNDGVDTELNHSRLLDMACVTLLVVAS